MPNNVIKFVALLGGTLLLLLVLRWTGLLVFDARQIASIGIFSMFIYGTLLFGDFRLAFAFGGVALLIALKTGLSFIDFLRWAAPIALVVNVVTYGICRWWFADAFDAFAVAVKKQFTARERKRAPAEAVLVGAGAGGGGGDIPAAADE